MFKLVLLKFYIPIKFPLPCSYNILLIGDSHFGHLKKQFVFTNVDIIGVPGLTTAKLDQWCGRMLHYTTVVILCGGNDVVRHPRTNRPPVSIEVVLRNLIGMSTLTNSTGCLFRFMHYCVFRHQNKVRKGRDQCILFNKSTS